MAESLVNILLVEDNLADALYTRELLPQSGYTFIEARSLAQALECSQHEHIDVALLDLSLPDSHGLDTIAKLILQRKEMPVVVLTGFEDINCAIDSLHAGAHDYIVKNRLSPEALVSSINLAIESKKRQLTEERLLEHTRLSNLTAAVGQSLVQLVPMKEILGGCTDAMVAHLDAALARIWIMDDDAKKLILQASSGIFTDIAGTEGKLPLDSFRIGLIASERKLNYCNALQEDPCLFDPERAKQEGLVSFAGQPLLVGSRLIGVMAIFARQELADITINALAALADQIALGIDRRIAEDARTRLASIVESSEDGIISKTLEGIVLSWNQAAERIYGFSAGEIIGKSISILMPDGEKELEGILAKLRRGERIGDYEGRRRRKDGVLIDVSLTVSPIKDASGAITGASTIVRDISKRKRAEQLLRTQNDVTAMLAACDSLADVASGMLELIARAILFDFGAIWSLDRQDQLLKCIDTWHDGDASLSEFDKLSKHLTFAAGATLPGRVLLKGQPAWIGEIAMDSGFARASSAGKGGLHVAVAIPIMLGTQVLGVIEFLSRKSLEPDAEVYQMMASIGSQIGQFMDRKHAEFVARQAAQAQEGIARAIMENAPIGIVRLSKNLVISEVNQAFCQQFGVQQDQLPGTFIFQIETGISSERLISVVELGLPYTTENFRIVLGGAQGPRDAYCDLAIWPVKDEREQTVGLVILTVEVTERVNLAKQREDFVATLTHDLKGPLHGQDRMLDLMLKGQLGPLQDQQTEILSLLRVGTQDLLQLIGTLLEVYRYEDGQAQLRLDKLDITKLIGSCIAQLNPIAETKGIKISFTHPETAQTVDADQMALRRVVTNLLDNAMKFTLTGGFIHVSCQSTDSEFVLTIDDSGPGIAESEIQALFQRFSQTGTGREHKGGTGLGLYLCRQIVEAHGGSITCASKEDIGSTFVVTIPVLAGLSAQQPGHV